MEVDLEKQLGALDDFNPAASLRIAPTPRPVALDADGSDSGGDAPLSGLRVVGHACSGSAFSPPRCGRLTNESRTANGQFCRTVLRQNRSERTPRLRYIQHRAGPVVQPGALYRLRVVTRAHRSVRPTYFF